MPRAAYGPTPHPTTLAWGHPGSPSGRGPSQHCPQPLTCRQGSSGGSGSGSSTARAQSKQLAGHHRVTATDWGGASRSCRSHKPACGNSPPSHQGGENTGVLAPRPLPAPTDYYTPIPPRPGTESGRPVSRLPPASSHQTPLPSQTWARTQESQLPKTGLCNVLEHDSAPTGTYGSSNTNSPKLKQRCCGTAQSWEAGGCRSWVRDAGRTG